MPIEKSSLTAHETTAHCQRHYGSSSMRLRLVIYSQRGRSALPLRSSKNVLFPAWEYFIPNVGINAWVLCLISRSYWMIRIPYWTINGTYPIKFLHLSHQDARSPLDRGFPLISSLPCSLPPTLPYPSRLVQLRKAWGFLLWQANKFERTGVMMGEIWERLETSLPCSNPFLQRLFQRFRERWEIFGLQIDRGKTKLKFA